MLFTSDHGSMLYDHGVDNDKHAFLDAAWRVPLLARWPGVLPPGATAAFASTVDLTTTILAAAGVAPRPASAPYGAAANASEQNSTFFMAGYDLFAPLVAAARRRGPRAPHSAVVAADAPAARADAPPARAHAVAGSMYRGYAVVTAKYKLMYFTEEGDRRG